MLRQKKDDRRKNEDRGNLIHLRFAYVSVRLSHTGPGSGKLVALQPWCHYSPTSWAIFLVPPLLRGHNSPVLCPGTGCPGQDESPPGAPHLCARAGPTPQGPFCHLPGPPVAPPFSGQGLSPPSCAAGSEQKLSTMSKRKGSSDRPGLCTAWTMR